MTTRFIHKVRVRNTKGENPPTAPPVGQFFDIEVLDKVCVDGTSGQQSILDCTAVEAKETIIDNTGDNNGRDPYTIPSRFSHMLRVTNPNDPTQFFDLEVLDKLHATNYGIYDFTSTEVTAGILDTEGKDISNPVSLEEILTDPGDPTQTRQAILTEIGNGFFDSTLGAVTGFFTVERLQKITFTGTNGQQYILDLEDDFQDAEDTTTYIGTDQFGNPIPPDNAGPDASTGSPDPQWYAIFAPRNNAGIASNFYTDNCVLSQGPLWHITDAGSQYFVAVRAGIFCGHRDITDLNLANNPGVINADGTGGFPAPAMSSLKVNFLTNFEETATSKRYAKILHSRVVNNLAKFGSNTTGSAQRNMHAFGALPSPINGVPWSPTPGSRPISQASIYNIFGPYSIIYRYHPAYGTAWTAMFAPIVDMGPAVGARGYVDMYGKDIVTVSPNRTMAQNILRDVALAADPMRGDGSTATTMVEAYFYEMDMLLTVPGDTVIQFQFGGGFKGYNAFPFPVGSAPVFDLSVTDTQASVPLAQWFLGLVTYPDLGKLKDIFETPYGQVWDTFVVQDVKADIVFPNYLGFGSDDLPFTIGGPSYFTDNQSKRSGYYLSLPTYEQFFPPVPTLNAPNPHVINQNTTLKIKVDSIGAMKVVP